MLEGMRFFGHHGDVDAERVLGAHFEVDVELQADLRPAARSDDLADTLDYVRCYELVRDVVENTQFRLLEAVAERIADVLLRELNAPGVRVRVAKQPPIAGEIRRFAVDITRQRDSHA